MLWALIITDIGFIAALVMYWELGWLFRLPMLLNLAVSLLVNYSGILTNEIQTAVFISLYGLLFILWVVILAGLQRGITGAVVSFLLVVVTITVGMLEAANFDIRMEGAWIRLSTTFIYTWTACIFLVILGVFLKSAAIRWHHGYWNLLLTPKRRALIPIGLWSALICLSELYRTFLPQLYEIRFVTAAFCLGWGWAAIEFPHFMESLSHKQGRSD